MALVPTLIRRIGFRYRAANYWKLGDPSYDERQPYLVMGNALYTSLLEYIDEEKPSDQLVNTFTRSDGIAVGGVAGVWKSIPVLVTNDIDTISINAKAYHTAFVTNPAAVTAAYRTPDLAFEQGAIWVNIAGTPTKLFGWSMDTEAVMGATVVNGQLLYRFAVRAEA